MDDLLPLLFAAAIRYSGLPAAGVPPPIQALPYRAMLKEVCADLKTEARQAQVLYSQCTRLHRMQPAACGDLESEARHYDQCLGQHGLVAAYLIGQGKIVYRDDLDLDNDSDNSFIVHEYVHALQERRFGERLFDTCQGVLASERQAYRAQQAYLKSRGQLLRVGERLRYVTCGDIR